jgi:hypothetical protein
MGVIFCATTSVRGAQTGLPACFISNRRSSTGGTRRRKPPLPADGLRVRRNTAARDSKCNKNAGMVFALKRGHDAGAHDCCRQGAYMSHRSIIRQIFVTAFCVRDCGRLVCGRMGATRRSVSPLRRTGRGRRRWRGTWFRAITVRSQSAPCPARYPLCDAQSCHLSTNGLIVANPFASGRREDRRK